MLTCLTVEAAAAAAADLSGDQDNDGDAGGPAIVTEDEPPTEADLISTNSAERPTGDAGSDAAPAAVKKSAERKTEDDLSVLMLVDDSQNDLDSDLSITAATTQGGAANGAAGDAARIKKEQEQAVATTIVGGTSAAKATVVPAAGKIITATPAGSAAATASADKTKRFVVEDW